MPLVERSPSILDVSIEAKVEFLRRPDSYPEATRSVRVVETHMSWVFLTDNFAYKLKKPVSYEFLDFSTLPARRHYCEEEVRLNRDLAPGVYLGTVPLVLCQDGSLGLGTLGSPVDWLVKSHRLPDEKALDRVLRSGLPRDEDIRKIAELLAGFYRRAPPAPVAPILYERGWKNEIRATRRALLRPEFGLSKSQVQCIANALETTLQREAALFDARAAKIVEGHGDLRPEHIYLTSPPVIVDRLEFSREFRTVDPIEELAYLAMECELLQAPGIGERLFQLYALLTEDSPSPQLILFHKTYRAYLRAKLSAQHFREPRDAGPEAWIAKAKGYLALADAYATRLDALTVDAERHRNHD